MASLTVNIKLTKEQLDEMGRKFIGCFNEGLANAVLNYSSSDWHGYDATAYAQATQGEWSSPDDPNIIDGVCWDVEEEPLMIGPGNVV